MNPRAPRRRDLVGRAVDAKELRLVVFVERHEPGEAARHARMPGERAVLRARQLQAQLQFAQQHGQRARGQHVQNDRLVWPRAIPPARTVLQANDTYMTARSLIERITQQEDINFLLTNRIPRRWLTQLMGWLSRIEHPWVCAACIVLVAAVLRPRSERGEESPLQEPARLLHPRAEGRRPADRRGSRGLVEPLRCAGGRLRAGAGRLGAAGQGVSLSARRSSGR